MMLLELQRAKKLCLKFLVLYELEEIKICNIQSPWPVWVVRFNWTEPVDNYHSE